VGGNGVSTRRCRHQTMCGDGKWRRSWTRRFTSCSPDRSCCLRAPS